MEFDPVVRGTQPVFINHKLRCLQGNRAHPPVLIYTNTCWLNTRIKWTGITSWFYTCIHAHVYEEHWRQKYRLRYTHMHTHLCWHADYSRPYIECVFIFENICKFTLSSGPPLHPCSHGPHRTPKKYKLSKHLIFFFPPISWEISPKEYLCIWIIRETSSTPYQSSQRVAGFIRVSVKTTVDLHIDTHTHHTNTHGEFRQWILSGVDIHLYTFVYVSARTHSHARMHPYTRTHLYD